MIQPTVIIPAGKNPRRLCQLSARAFAEKIPVLVLPYIELFLSDNELFDNYYHPNKFYIMARLKRIKNWFWEDLRLLFGAEEHEIRLLIEAALNDAIDLHCEVTSGPRDQQLFVIFVFQLLFQYSAGRLATGETYGVDHLCNNLRVLLEYLEVCETSNVSFANLVFREYRHIFPILKSVPHLSRLNLHTSFHPALAIILQENCPKLQVLEMEFPSAQLLDDVELKLCAFFFFGVTMGDLYLSILIGMPTNLSFPSLQAVQLWNRSNQEEPDLSLVAFLFQHFHQEVKVSWNHTVKRSNVLSEILRRGIPCHSIVLEQQYLGFDNVGIHLNTDGGNNRSTRTREVSVFRRAAHIYLSRNVMDNARRIYIANLLENCCCSSLEVHYSPLVSQRLFTVLEGTFSFIKKLYLTGPLYKPQDGQQLYTLIHNCNDLHVLAIKLDLVQDLGCVKLKKHPNLQEISLKVVNYPHWERFPVIDTFGSDEGKGIEHKVNQFMKFHVADHHMPAYIGSFNLMDFLSSYNPPRIPNYQGALRSGFVSTIISENMPEKRQDKFVWRNCTLSHLSEVVFGADELKYDIPTRPLHNYGYGVLEYENFNSFQNGGYLSNATYRVPHFAFYGKEKYGFPQQNTGCLRYSPYAFKGNGTGVYIYSVYRDALPVYKGFTSGNHRLEECDPDTYGHLNSEIKDSLVYNRSLETNENSLKQWRPDMRYSAPVNLLRSLMYASPNVEVLEIPDLRVTDIDLLFLDITMANCLSKVHTLHLSSQFSRPLAQAVRYLPSLRTVNVDPLYGIANFLRFKKSLRTTQLSVSCRKSRVWLDTHVNS